MDSLTNEFKNINLSPERKKLRSFITLNTIKYYNRRGFKELTVQIPLDFENDARLIIRDIGFKNNIFITHNVVKINDGWFLKIMW